MTRGEADVVVVAYGSTSKTGPGRDRSLEETHPVDGFVRPTGLFRPPGAYAMAARRHMHEYGTTEEQLAEIAVATREWASMNPKAAQQEPITVDDVVRVSTNRRAVQLAGLLSRLGRRRRGRPRESEERPRNSACRDRSPSRAWRRRVLTARTSARCPT